MQAPYPPSFYALGDNPKAFRFMQEHGLFGMIYVASLEEHSWYLNPALLSQLGLAPRDHDGYVQEHKKAINDFIDKTGEGDSLLKLMDSNQQTVLFHCKGMRLGDDQMIYGCYDKITSEEAPQSEIQRYRHILDGTSIGIWEWNIQTGEVTFNEEWANVLGYTLEELEPYNEDLWKSLSHPEDFKMCEDLLQEHFDNKTDLYQSEARMRHKNGQWVWVYDQGKVVSWKNGKPQWMTGYHREITQAKLEKEIKKTFIDQAPGAIAMFDKNLNYLAVSAQWLKDYEISDPIIGKNHYEVFNIPKRWKDIHKKCLKGETHESEDDNFIGPDGEVQYLKWQVKPWYGNQGEIGGIIMQTTNLTPIKKLEIQRHRDRQLMGSVFNTMDVGVVVCNEHGELTFFNNATRKWHGIPTMKVPREELSSYYNLYYEDATTPLKEEDIPLLKVLNGVPLSKNEVIVIKSTVGTRYVKVKGEQLFNKDGKLTGAAVTMYDITSDIEAREKLRISEETFRGSFEHAAMGMALVSTTGKWIKVNNKVPEIFGYTEEELLKITFQDITHPNDLNKDLKHFKKLLDNESNNYQIEKRYFHKSGEIITALLSVSIVRNEEDEPLFFVSQILDITELKKSRTSLEQILRVTKSQNERLKNFAHIVSHNLRSHSGNFEMLLNILLENNPTYGDDPIINMLKTASNQLSETIEHLNEVSAINTNKDLVLQPLNLKEYISKVIDGIAGLIRENHVEVIDKVTSQWNVMGIPAYLESIILNFTTNAIKYRSEERDSFVKFSCKKQDKYLVLSIEDNGMGIDLKRNQGKIFGMYKTFHRHQDSRGIGLFLSKNQIEAMGGKVSVTSKVDEGTIFNIYFKHEKN